MIDKITKETKKNIIIRKINKRNETKTKQRSILEHANISHSTTHRDPIHPIYRSPIYSICARIKKQATTTTT